jgi:hypothetical protein
MSIADQVLRGTLGGVMLSALDPLRYPLERYAPTEGRAMRWPSRIAAVEERVQLEGFYGFSTIVGKHKLGKSLLAFGSAALAASEGLRVIYVDAELDALQLTTRLVNFGGADWYPRNRENFVVRMLSGPCSLTGLVEDIALNVGAETERVLVVLDSISRIAQRVVNFSRAPAENRPWRPLDYWSALNLVIDWCAQIRRAAPTQIGVLVTSEENQHGTSKGQQIEYAGDMALRIKGEAGSDVVALSVPFSREGGDGELGMYRRDFRSARFVRCDRIEADEHRPAEWPL